MNQLSNNYTTDVTIRMFFHFHSLFFYSFLRVLPSSRRYFGVNQIRGYFTRPTFFFVIESTSEATYPRESRLSIVSFLREANRGMRRTATSLATRLTVPGQDWCVPRVIVITLILIPREVIDTINKLTGTD